MAEAVEYLCNPPADFNVEVLEEIFKEDEAVAFANVRPPLPSAQPPSHARPQRVACRTMHALPCRCACMHASSSSHTVPIQSHSSTESVCHAVTSPVHSFAALKP